jgi:hypothetical protein
MYANSNAVSSSAGVPMGNTDPVRMPEVQGAIDRLAANTETLDKMLGELEVRLSGVLAQHKTAESGQPSSPEPVRVPLAEVLTTRANHVRVLMDRVQSMLERIEL